MKLKLLVLLLLALLPGMLFSAPVSNNPAPLTDQELAQARAWFYTMTPDEALQNVALMMRLLNGKETITFPETLYALSEKGTLVIWWKDPLYVKLGDRIDKFTLPQIEKKNFIQLKQDPLGWVEPAGIGAGVGIIAGVIITAIILH